MTNLTNEETTAKIYSDLNAQFDLAMKIAREEHQAQLAILEQRMEETVRLQNITLGDLRAQQRTAQPAALGRSSYKIDFKLIGKFSGSEKLLVFEEWKFSIEDYLSSYPEIPPRESVLFVSQRLEGSAKTWYQAQVRTLNTVFADYHHLLGALEAWTNAGKLPTRDRDLLAELKQTSSVTDLIQRLSNIRARLTITDGEAQDRFRRGLKKEIRIKVDSTSLLWPDVTALQKEALKQEGVTNYQRSSGAPIPTTNDASAFGDNMEVDATEIALSLIHI
jgi:hypothetical protein